MGIWVGVAGALCLLVDNRLTAHRHLYPPTRSARRCSNEWYAQHLASVHDNKQEIMLGYSDSGGCCAAAGLLSWLCVSAGLCQGW